MLAQKTNPLASSVIAAPPSPLTRASSSDSDTSATSTLVPYPLTPVVSKPRTTSTLAVPPPPPISASSKPSETPTATVSPARTSLFSKPSTTPTLTTVPPTLASSKPSSSPKPSTGAIDEVRNSSASSGDVANGAKALGHTAVSAKPASNVPSLDSFGAKPLFGAVPREAVGDVGGSPFSEAVQRDAVTCKESTGFWLPHDLVVVRLHSVKYRIPERWLPNASVAFPFSRGLASAWRAVDPDNGNPTFDLPSYIPKTQWEGYLKFLFARDNSASSGVRSIPSNPQVDYTVTVEDLTSVLVLSQLWKMKHLFDDACSQLQLVFDKEWSAGRQIRMARELHYAKWLKEGYRKLVVQRERISDPDLALLGSDALNVLRLKDKYNSALAGASLVLRTPDGGVQCHEGNVRILRRIAEEVDGYIKEEIELMDACFPARF